MGQEAQCTVRFGKQVSAGKALLEGDMLLFRGTFRLPIPFKHVRSVAARNGLLRVRFSGGVATLKLGPLAERWVKKIRSPKSLIDKLGVTSDSRVAILGVRDAGFWTALTDRAKQISKGRLMRETDMIFFAADRRADLSRLRSLQMHLKPNGAIWVVAPKGVQHLTEGDVLAAGKQVGLVDTKVVSFSATHTAHKFVIPVARRRTE